MNTTLQDFLSDAKHFDTIPVTSHFHSDTLTPIQIFHSLKDEAVYMLESNDSSSPWSRYSFIGLDPFIEINKVEDSFRIRNLKSNGEFFADTLKSAFYETLAVLNVKVPETEVPFSGGAVGYVAYDAIADFEKVKLNPKNESDISSYHLLFCKTILAYDQETQKVSLIHYQDVKDFKGSTALSELFCNAQDELSRILNKLQRGEVIPDLMLPSIDTEGNQLELVSNYRKEKYLADVDKIKKYIRTGDIFQAVLSQRFEKKTNLTGLEIYRILRKVNPSPYLFYLNFNETEIIGSSPERLIQVYQGEMEIHPIAGTRKRGRNTQEDADLAADLLADEKERAEHYMLVDLARNDIGRVAKYGSVKVPVETEIGYFSHVMHMISKVTGQLKENLSPIDAFISAFPAGTLTGAPKVRAMEIINELEPTKRNIYGGSIVYFGFDGNIDSCIAIRTATLKNKTVYIQAGAGIVADSSPEKEWEETVNKASGLLRTIELAEKVFNKDSFVNFDAITH